MVKGVGALHRRLQRVPRLVRDEVTAAMEAAADDLVNDMKALAPLPEIALAIKWTWGDAPAGSLKIGTVGGTEYGKIAITVYVEAGPGAVHDAWYAHFFEFGTAERVQKKTGRRTGRIVAQPFFWPAWRSNRRGIKTKLSRAVTRGLKKV